MPKIGTLISGSFFLPRIDPGRIRDFFEFCILRLLVVFFQAASKLYSAVVVLKHKWLFMPLNSATPAQQWQLMRNRCEDTRKAMPKHICFALLGSTPANLEDVSRAVVWSHALGVKFISIFDPSGTLQKFPEVLRTELRARLFECRQPKDSLIILKPDEDVRNVDFRSSRSVVYILDAKNGHEKLEIFIGRILNEAVRAKEKSLQVADIRCDVKEIEKRLSVAFSGFPDPECVLCFGPITTSMKVLPWQFNHTEILKVDSHRKLLPSRFLQAFDRYTKIEKRFGK